MGLYEPFFKTWLGMSTVTVKKSLRKGAERYLYICTPEAKSGSANADSSNPCEDYEAVHSTLRSNKSIYPRAILGLLENTYLIN